MGAMAAVVDKRGSNAVPTILAMLRSLMHRGTDAHGVATQASVKIARSLEELEDTDLNSDIAIGYDLSRITGRDVPQPVLGNGYALVFDGRFFPCNEKTSLEEAASRLKEDSEESARRVLKELDGAYAFAVSYSNKMVAGRDALGIIPLYYGENENTCGLASERKALWALGMRNVRSFPPGNIAVITTQGFTYEKVATVVQPPIKSISLEASARHLRNLLSESTTERVKDVEKIAVAFSGGLDSSVVAVLAKMSGVDVHLISVGLENQQELQHAENASNALGLPIHVQTYDVSDVEKALSKVLWLIEEPNQMKVGVAIPFFWTAEIASKTGCRVLLAGQGGDELFGGYKRYLAELDKKGVEALQKILHQDVVSSYKTNFQRDHPVCAFHKVELHLPFIDREVVNFALSLPLKLKIESIEDSLRKRVLRKVAESLKIPDFIANRTKKAVQYATGVNKALKKLAKSEDLTVSDYLNQLFYKTYPDLEASS
ncbi:MAG: asparagine synthetase B family protein [Candidatus Bathyarchaeia archaeon]